MSGEKISECESEKREEEEKAKRKEPNGPISLFLYF
jgi:hypothetical protein